MAPPVQIDQASINVDLEWTNFMTVLSQTYKLATSLALEEGTEPHHQEEIWNISGKQVYAMVKAFMHLLCSRLTIDQDTSALT